MVRTEIYLTTRQKNILRALGKRKGVSIASLIRLAIDLYIEQLEKEAARGSDETV